MLQAKPTAHDYEEVRRFLNGMQLIFDDREHPDTTSEDDPKAISDADAFDWLEKNYRRFDLSIDRVVNAGEVAINNACDPSVDHLALKPELKNAAAQRDALLAACCQLLTAPHQEHFATRLNEQEMAGLDAIKAAVALCEVPTT